MRIAISCCGLEHVRRGFILFKGSGKSEPNEIVVPCLRRDFLVHFMSPHRAFYWEQISFAIGLVPFLFLKRIDIVHYSEGNVGNALAQFLRWTRSRSKLLLCNGGPISPINFRPELHIQQVTKDGLDSALRFGIAPERMHLVPHGIAPERFRMADSRETMREHLGIPRDKKLILTLAALNKEHKRLDYVIREVAALHDDSLFLCMAGEPSPEKAELENMASQLLPGRHVFLTVPRNQVPDLLASADLFVHAALLEGFGLVLIEAAAAGVPVVCHNSPHFQWILGDGGVYVDMAAPGALSSTLRELIAKKELLLRQGELGRERADKCFSWRVLIPRYLEMYEAVRKS